MRLIKSKPKRTSPKLPFMMVLATLGAISTPILAQTNSSNCIVDQCKVCRYKTIDQCDECQSGYYLRTFYGKEKGRDYNACWSTLKLIRILYGVVLLLSAYILCCYYSYQYGKKSALSSKGAFSHLSQDQAQMMPYSGQNTNRQFLASQELPVEPTTARGLIQATEEGRKGVEVPGGGQLPKKPPKKFLKRIAPPQLGPDLPVSMDVSQMEPGQPQPGNFEGRQRVIRRPARGVLQPAYGQPAPMMLTSTAGELPERVYQPPRRVYIQNTPLSSRFDRRVEEQQRTPVRIHGRERTPVRAVNVLKPQLVMSPGSRGMGRVLSPQNSPNGRVVVIEGA